MQKKMRNWFLATIAIAVLVVAGCNPQGTSASQNGGSTAASQNGSTSTPTASASPSPSASAAPQSLEIPRLEGKATVVLTVKGAPITIELDGTNAPVTAGNFVDLVEKKVYDGLVFHRVVREPQPFVVQGGDPQSKNPNAPLDRLGTGGYEVNGQPRSVPLEIKPEGSAPPVYGRTLEPGTKPKLKHTRGAVAMARSANPDSASSQFYVALADLNFLDGNYAVFGYVTQGMDVVDKIQQGDRIDSAKVTAGIENLKTSASPAASTTPSATPSASPTP